MRVKVEAVRMALGAKVDQLQLNKYTINAYLNTIKLGIGHIHLHTELLVETWERRQEAGQVTVLGPLVNK